MSAHDEWQRNNDAWLGAAVQWLRLRLDRLGSTGLPAPPPADRRVGRARLFGRAVDEAGPAGEAPAADDETARARAAMDAGAGMALPPAALLLQRRFGLLDFELHVLLLCVAFELDTRIAELCARAHGDAARTYPTYALALAALPEPAWDALSPERPLRFWRLIEVVQSAAAPLTASPLRVDERILHFVKGLNHLDERLAPYCSLLSTPHGEPSCRPSPSQQSVAADLAAAHASGAAPSLFHLLGPDAPSKHGVAIDVANRLSLALYLLPASVLPAASTELDAMARTWRRESLLMPVALYVDARDVERDAAPVTRFLARSGGLVFLDSRDSWRHAQREAHVVDIDRPTRTEQRDQWRAQLGDAALADVLASQFRLSVAEIRRASLAVSASGDEAGEGLWEACRAASRPRLDLLAQRLDAKAGWEDLVLPAAETAALREIAVHARRRVQVFDEWGFAARMNRGLGVNALFAGESGTGKTMAAEVIARELGLDLYRIDLSAVVSKYIGETEKNLRLVFDAAEDGGAILFFDEADALFGKRSDVKDSHDRYANIEVNYLLQRMEAYSGLAILATNAKGSLDTAFFRRLRFVVQFPFPGHAERLRIWSRAFPPELPVDELDFAFLARLPVPGGTIHNIALRAAFLAAGAQTAVSMPLVLDAARAEFRKLERPIAEADFRWPGRRPEAVA